MGLLSFFRKEKVELLYAPCKGVVLHLSQVPDPVFADKIIGDGVALDPQESVVVSPCDGLVGKIFDTNHAFHIVSPLGLEIFVHVGVDTINLKGQGFKRLMKEGSHVNRGTPILELDLEFLRNNTASVLIPIIIANSEEKLQKLTPHLGPINSGDIMLEAKLR